ncbi:hypothetical protein F5Y17DRAFT_451013 [Xylariaceae sp. FL0594]|nr:hypothetical protein F5Y17DRAFT_451013 [Xylariaceae sp. FL0594]
MYPLVPFALSFGLFYFAIQEPKGHRRHFLGILHTLSAVCCLRAQGIHFLPISEVVWVQFIIWATLHTSTSFLLEEDVLNLGPLQYTHRLRAVVRTWTNIRRVPLTRWEDGRAVTCRTRYRFALTKAVQACGLLGVHRVTRSLALYSLVKLGTHLADFEPSKQAILPPINQKDLCLRAIFSLQWIWDSYVILTASHCLFAAVSVTLLCWDSPEDWPPLFGSVAEAYSLTRFWGTFWHRLHAVPFRLLQSRALAHMSGAGEEHKKRLKSLWQKFFRALLMFTFSALGHVAVNWITLGRAFVIPELRFFLSNFFICFGEKLARPWVSKVPYAKTLKSLGYLWVFAVFFCLVPSWIFPSVLFALSQ